MEELDHLEAARELFKIGASRRVVEESLIYRGLDRESASKVAATASRSLSTKKVVPFVVAMVIGAALGYVVMGWPGAAVFAFIFFTFVHRGWLEVRKPRKLPYEIADFATPYCVYVPEIAELCEGRVLSISGKPSEFLRTRDIMSILPKTAELIRIGSLDGHAVAQFGASNEQSEFGQVVDMDLRSLTFVDEYFDAVVLSRVHALPGVAPVLTEARRVLKPGGHAILVDIVCDDQTEAQMTLSKLRNWLNELSIGAGMVPQRVFTRRDLVGLAVDFGLNPLNGRRIDKLTPPLRAGKRVKDLDHLIREGRRRAKNLPDAERLLAQGEDLRRMLREPGVQEESQYVLVAQKP